MSIFHRLDQYMSQTSSQDKFKLGQHVHVSDFWENYDGYVVAITKYRVLVEYKYFFGLFTGRCWCLHFNVEPILAETPEPMFQKEFPQLMDNWDPYQ